MQRKLAAWGALAVVLAGVGLAVRGTGMDPVAPPHPVIVSAPSTAVALPHSGNSGDGAPRLASGHGLLEADFSPSGAVEVRAHGGRAVRVSVEGFGRGGVVKPGAPAGAAFVRDGASGRLAREGNGLREWWVSLPEGMEQGFDVASAPSGKGPLTVWLSLDVPASVDGDGRGAHLRTAMGELAYAGLVATDARGRALPARMEAWTKGLALRVEDRGAAYPVRIDPVFTAVAQNTISPSASADFGLALAVVGDVDGDGCDDVATSAADLSTAYVYRGCAALSDGGQGLSTTPFATLTGAGGNASRVFAPGDVNGDGRADLVVASPSANGNAGVLDVWLGGASGMSAGGAGFSLSGSAGDELGYDVVAVGDVNLDGKADVVVGSPGYGTESGIVQLLLGGSTGWQAGNTWDGPALGSRFGQSLSGAGDVNGDGLPDLLVGAPRKPTLLGLGAAYLYTGEGVGFALAPAWVLESSQADSELGFAVARAGDVDGDGYADFVVGERLYDEEAVNGGRMTLYLGAESGPVMSQVSLVSLVEDAQLGTRLGCAGDINGDGYSDVFANLPNANGDAGSVLRFYGSPGQKLTLASANFVGAAGARIGRSPAVRGDVTGDGIADVVYGNPTYSRITSWPGLAGAAGDGGAVVQSAGAPSAGFGQAVAGVGDVDGDGYPDLVVGSPLRSSGSLLERGQAVLFNGSAGGLVTPAAWSVVGSEASAHLGAAVAAAGDVNADGFADVLVASPDQDASGAADVGRVALYLGSPGGLSPTAAWTYVGTQDNEHLGESLAGLGDVNGDGFADVAVGAPQHDGAAGVDSGKVFVFYGHGSGAPLSATPDVSFEGLASGVYYGRGLAGADVNGDGLGDLLVGIPEELGGQGLVQALQGETAGLRDAGCIWSRSGLAGDTMGAAVARAGDVNGDGRDDVLVGAPGNGKVSLYLGGATGPGLSARWIYSPSAGALRAASAGDLNGDGLSDVAVGLPDSACLDGAQCGAVELFLAPFSSQLTTPSSTLSGTQFLERAGEAVVGVGDITGDGFGDLLLGAPGFDTPSNADEGRVALHYGNSVDVAGPGVPLGARLLQPGTHSVVPAGGRSTSNSAVDVGFLTARSPLGRVRAKAEVEVKPVGTAFNGQGTVESANWTLLEGAGTELKVPVTGLQEGAAYRWRARLRYHPNDVVSQARGRWVYGQGGVVGAAHFRTAAKANGTACSGATECTSGYCVDGVCCSGACSGGCDACTQALGASADGTCTVFAQGSPGSCSPYVCGGQAVCPTSCSQDAQCAAGNYCNGGSCTAKKSNGQACTAAGECTSGNCADGFCCNSACGGGCDVCSAAKGASADGTCTVLQSGSTSGTCSPYRCGGQAACPTTCSGNADCATGSNCVNNACTATLSNGQSCSAGNQCASGNCVDGVCCNSACGGGCDVCSAGLGATANGTCTVLASGQPGTCSPYLCRGNASCPANCTQDAQCASGNYCGAGACTAKKSTGASCAAATECTSGNCVDGFCCSSACSGGCDVCSAALGATANGTCTALAAGQPGSCGSYLCGGSASCPTSCTGNTQCASGSACLNNACTALLSNGGACTSNAQCTSGNCVDGVCCNSACGGGCDVCSAALGATVNGTCTVLAAGQAGSCGSYLCGGQASCPTSCTGNAECKSGSACLNNACTPTLPTGQACTSSAQCTSGNCADGFCCNSACSGGCDVCSAALGASANGTCTVLGSGSAGSCGNYVCRGQASCPTSCNNNGQCASGSACLANACTGLLANGQFCTANAQCTSGFCADGVCCGTACSGGCDVCSAALGASSDGTCTVLAAGAAGACNPYVCGGSAACPTTCTADAQCASGNACVGGACVQKKANGGACAAANECTSGFCADGVCCNGACSGGCDVCSSALGASLNGTCTVLAAGAAGSCSPYLCAGQASCPGSCTADAQCAAGSACIQGACVGKKANGLACGSAAECTSGFCADGVCCNGACAGGCDVCSAALGASANGTCTVLPSGAPGACGAYLCRGQAGCPSDCTSNGQCATGSCSDGVCCDTPCGGGSSLDCQACSRAAGASADGTCTVLSSYTCRAAAGACDVAEQCTGQSPDCPSDVFTSGTQCAEAECVDGFYRPALTCSGAEANCPTALPTSCGGYACEGTACRTQCSSHLECAAGFRCTDTGECAPKLNAGAACQSPAECTTGFCVDGVCCGSQCAGQCEACDLPGQEGQCRPVTGTPRGSRPACEGAGDVCGGACNGVVVNACSYPGSAVTCRSPSCAAGVATLSAACDGAGRCPEQTQPCGLQPCAGDACSSGCAVDAECEAGSFCAGGVCRPKFVQGAACAVSTQCASGACVDGFCCDRACGGQCEACDIPGSVGRCTTVVTGQPHGARPACAGTGTCQGACDGSSAAGCGYPGSSVACAPAQCEVGQVLGESSCNGAGTCARPEPVSCGAYACLGEACATSCTTDAECNYGNMCKDGGCVKYAPKPQPKPAEPESCSQAGGAAASAWLAALVLAWARRRGRA
ncbi:MAG: hypothetical protein RL653_78 [Pseudomonadota bacterium]